MGLSHAIANRLWLASGLGEARRFAAALDASPSIQAAKLNAYLQENADTEIGRRYRFDRLHTFDDYRAAVPLCDYDDLAADIDRIAQGETNILTADPVIRLMPSSGSTRAAKLIPYTRSLQREFNAAIAPWIGSLYRATPALRNGPAYWSITPVAAPAASPPTRIPIGYEQDSAYLGHLAQRLINRVLATPDCLSRIGDMHVFRYVTLLLLLRCRALRLISVWHPSFLMLLMGDLPGRWPALLADIERGGCDLTNRLSPALQQTLRPHLAPLPRRAAELSALGPAGLTAIWPNLRCISCWADGPAAAAVGPVRAAFPGVAIQAKGLLATEAFVSIPYADHHLLAIRSHVFEFIDAEQRSHLPHEVTIGEEYTLALTTAGGLYRYRLRDRVRIAGRVGSTPALTFLGKDDQVVDLFGEKLSEGFVSGILSRLNLDATFQMLAPERDASGTAYTLFVETNHQRGVSPASELDEHLSANPHYRYCRQLGQLQAARVRVVPAGAYARFVATLQQRGQRLGDIKPSALRPETDWRMQLETPGDRSR